MSSLEDLLSTLEFTPTDGGGLQATSLDEGRGVVFGGQLLAQTIAAAAAAVPSHEVKSVHTVFARGASVEAPLDIDVDVLHQGRSAGSVNVTIRQGDRLCTQALVLMHVPDPDLIRHEAPMPTVGKPDDFAPRSPGGFWDIRIVDDVDFSDPDLVGPAELNVWSRFEGAPAAPAVNQALLAYATDGFLIATAMRPHKGVGQAQAHVSVSTTVMSHTITFHEPVDASQWLLLAHESPYAGRGRSYGRAHVFTEDGHHVASYVQENMIRAFPEGQAPGAGQRSKH